MAPGPLVWASVWITAEASTISSARPQRNPAYRPNSLNNRHKVIRFPCSSLAHTIRTHCQQNGITPGYTCLPSFSFQQACAMGQQWTGLSVVHGWQSTQWRPGWYGMVWCEWKPYEAHSRHLIRILWRVRMMCQCWRAWLNVFCWSLCCQHKDILQPHLDISAILSNLCSHMTSSIDGLRQHDLPSAEVFFFFY